MGKEFHSLVVSRRFGSTLARERPEVFGSAPKEVRGRRVLIVDETCDSGDTMRLAVSAVTDAGALEVRTAVAFQTGAYQPDFHSIATESTIILPWDREILVDGELVVNPRYATGTEHLRG
jgi:hypothetical protein